MKVYIVEYKHCVDFINDIWTSKVSQEGYSTLEKAQEFIEGKGNVKQMRPMFYKSTDTNADEYYIHDILIK